MGAAGKSAQRDPPTLSKANEDDIGSGFEKRLCKRDPPSDKNEVPTGKAHTTENDKMEVDTHTSFNEEVCSRWDFLRRGLRALGIIGSHTNVPSIDTSSDAAQDNDGPFYDAVEEHLAGDSDDDDETSNLRCVPTCRDHSWVEVVDRKRFSKPDP